MILKRFYDENLAQASYLVGCPGKGQAIVIDPNRDVEQYIEAAAAEKLEIAAVTETHIHADYVSGSLELAARTGATLYLSDEGDAAWKYTFARHPKVHLVKDGDEIRIGAIRLDVVHTPGHTPEHITFVLTDEAAGPEPFAAFTGDFIFAGDVGRPDLLERAAGFEGTMEEGARRLYDSLDRFLGYPEGLILFPAHGAGSACGKSLGAVPATSLGYEAKTGWAFRVVSKAEFVEKVLAGQPEPPVYFKEMKRINKVGPPILGKLAAPPRLGAKNLPELMHEQVQIVDIRPSSEVATGFIPGTLHIPLGKGFTTWAGWLLSYDLPIYLVSNGEPEAERALRHLASIGFDDVVGWFGPDALTLCNKVCGLETVPQITGEQAKSVVEGGEVNVLDVRWASELPTGSIPGSINIPLGRLPQRLDKVPKDKPLLVYCQTGVRSPMAIGLLRSRGFCAVENLIGGYPAYKTASAG